MNQIVDNVGTGKTQNLLGLADISRPATIVCKNPDKVREMAIQLHFSLRDLDFIDYKSYMCNDYDLDSSIFIDEISNLLRIYDIHIKAYTDTADRGGM